MEEGKYLLYIVIDCEKARWQHCKCLVKFCDTKTTDGSEEMCEFDWEVHCVHEYTLYTEYCS